MPTELYAGTLDDFNDSMAKAIEDALSALMSLPSVPPKVVEDRRKLFIAIANGVIKHLTEKQAALKIDFDVGLDHITTNPVIQTRS